jgi:hypothetical protein
MPQQNSLYVVVQSNGFGTAGFIVSLISFFCCGLTAPLGLLMSLIGLLQAPRGMAAAGVILGFLGSWWLWFMGMGMIATITGIPLAEKAAREAEEKKARTQIVLPSEAPQPRPSKIREQPRPSPRGIPDEPVERPVPFSSSEPALPTPRRIEPPPEPPAPKLRTWHAAEGLFSVEAEFVSMAGGSVKLRKADGSEINVPIEKLSEDDQHWIREYARAKAR